DLGGGRIAAVDQEITMHLRHLRAAIVQSTAAGRIDQFPGLAAGRVFESRTAGAALYRLRRTSRFSDFFHFGSDEFWIAALAREQGFGKDVIVGRTAMTIGVMHVRIVENVYAPAPIDRACLDQNVLGFTPIGAAIHAQRAADRAGNAAQER